ncbi:hypothetical protein M0812_07818 [Anaeramoeba flamelloides]|uniref:Armadillo repeat protein n=1 Tax=Anaeramoeba flamelloides TaxID=1746091 RepID=A0AAV7ZYH1_9EUKA|nr:hypothetical protein M0812_07818 [Anaeramoeba flamelloides]
MNDTTITDIIEQIKNNLDNTNHLLHYCIQLANLANDVEKRKAYAENGAIDVFILVLTNNLTNFKVIETILAGLINCSLYPQNIDYLVCSTDLIKLLGELFENLSDFQTRNFLRKKTKEKEKEKEKEEENEEENEKDELGESKNIINKTKVPHIMINILNTLVLEQGKKQGQEQESEEGKQIQNQYINLEILNSIQKKQYKPKFINHKIINLLIKIQRNQNNNSIISVYLFQIISFLIFEKNFINIVIDTEIWDLILNIIIENNTNDILTSTGFLCLGNLCSYKEFRSKFLTIDSFDYIITTISQKINNQTIIDNGSFFLVNATLEQEIKQYLSKQNNHIQMLKKLQQIYSNNKTISKRTEIILSRCK